MFSDDLQELHLFMTMLDLIPRGTETIASITEQWAEAGASLQRESLAEMRWHPFVTGVFFILLCYF